MGTEPSAGAPDNLGAHITSSARWVTAATVIAAAATWLTVTALSRVLERREFGLAALAIVAVAVFQLFQDSGLHAALIQRRDGIRAAADSAALYAPLTGLVLAGLCIAASPLAARFFHQAGVAPLMRGLAAVFVLRSFAIVPGALIQRELLFARQSVISIGSSVLYLGSAVGLALAGAGAWSVIGGQLLVSGWEAGAAWAVTPYRPDPRRASVRELRLLLHYGRHIVAGNIVGFVNSNTDPVAVGRLFGPVLLGAYTLGFQTGRQAVTVVTGISNVLVFPAYAKLQDDLPRFQRAYLRSLRFICTISTPAAFGLAAVGDVFIRSINGSRWAAAIPVLVIISFHGYFLSVSATTGEVFKAAGRPDLFFRMGVVQTALLFALIGMLYPFGIAGFAGARAGAAFVMGWVALVLAGRTLQLPLVKWLEALWAPAAAAAVMGAGVEATKLAIAGTAGDSLFLLAGLIVEGGVIYCVALRLIAAARWREFAGELDRLLPVRAAIGRLLRRRRDASPVGEDVLDKEREASEHPSPTLAPGQRPAGGTRPTGAVETGGGGEVKA